MTHPNWDQIEGRPETQPPRDNEFDRLCWSVMSAGNGAQLLEMLRKKYFETAFNPQSPEAALRVRITQQQFVRDLEAATKRGAEAAKAKNKPA